MARGLRITEDELLQFLSSDNTVDHLVWQATHVPPIKQSQIIHTAHGLDRRVTKIPQPTLRPGISPARELFKHYHQLPDLDARIKLPSNCGYTSRISPFHRKMTQTYRGSPVELPELGPRSISLAELMADMKQYEEMYKESPHLLDTQPAHLVAEAKRQLGWSLK
jgi:hypothetical protein